MRPFAADTSDSADASISTAWVCNAAIRSATRSTCSLRRSGNIGSESTLPDTASVTGSGSGGEMAVRELAVHRRVEVLAGVDALGLQRVREHVAGEAEAVGVDGDREVLVRAHVAGRDLLEPDPGDLFQIRAVQGGEDSGGVPASPRTSAVTRGPWRRGTPTSGRSARRTACRSCPGCRSRGRCECARRGRRRSWRPDRLRRRPAPWWA